jgi:mono/diheme cytochrome c family protein
VKDLLRTKVVVALLSAAVLAGAATYLVRQGAMNRLASRDEALQRQLQQAQSERQTAVARADARERELQAVRADSLELARLRAQMKTNSHPPVLPTGFYVGTEQPIYVTYGTADPVLRSFIRTLMSSGTDAAAKGEAIFQKTCAACHQRDGLGKPGVAPPLVGSEWVLAPGGQRLVRIVLNGMNGPITVQGRVWDLPMPPWRENLDDDAVAVVLNYIRSGLGTNRAAAIKSDLAGAARREPHPGPETALELLQLSVQ